MDQLLPQPPPDAPLPPPSEAALRSQNWRDWIWTVGLLSMIGVLGVVLTAPHFFRRPHYHDQTVAVNNARQIGIALFEFETEYGSFPDSGTVSRIMLVDPTNVIPMGAFSSNDCFRQLFVAGMVQSESMFYARTSSSRKPDGIFFGSRALEKDECGFAYIAGISAKGDPFTPIVLCPMVPGKRLFDYKLCKKYYNGKAVILRLDGSVMTHTVDKSGHVHIGGKDIFDPSQPFWSGKAPNVKWPE